MLTLCLWRCWNGLGSLFCQCDNIHCFLYCRAPASLEWISVGHRETSSESSAAGFQCCWIPFARILFRILAIISLKDTDLYYSFVVVVWIAKQCQRQTMNLKDFFPFIFLKESSKRNLLMFVKPFGPGIFFNGKCFIIDPISSFIFMGFLRHLIFPQSVSCICSEICSFLLGFFWQAIVHNFI